jgi:PAS domain S-box-containing protein
VSAGTFAEADRTGDMTNRQRVNILMVDDQPSKLLSYEAILQELGENLVQATSGAEALEKLLKMNDVAVVLMDVSMPEMDGFETARLIREHPRFQRTAIIFVSAIHLTDLDRVKGYERGAVDYVSVPVNPELLRAKVSVFAELYRTTRQLESLNRELERRVEGRTLELQESEARFRNLANSIPQLAWTADADGSILWYSERWYQYTGLSKQETNGSSWVTRVHPEELNSVLETWQASLDRGEPFEMEFRLCGADGVYRWFLTQVTPMRDSQGAITRWFGARTNIHEQREIRRMLEETQERLVLAQTAANCGTFDYDAQAGVNFWSDELQRLYGFVPGTFPRTYEAWIECVLPEDREIALASEKPSALRFFDTEFRIRRHDNGEIRWMNCRGRIQRDPSGKALRMVGLHIDITRTKRAEEDLKRAHEDLKRTHESLEVRVEERTAELRAAQERLRRLSGRLMQSQDEERRRIARELHDGLGQYLVAVKMNLDVVAMTAGETIAVPDNFTDAIKQIENAIAEIRTISHLLHPPLLDEVGLELALIWYAEGFAKRSGITVNVEIAPSIGRLDMEIETALFRVVQECLTNVHRHSGSSTANVRLARENGELRLEVRDEGKGMPGALSNEDAATPLAPGVGLQGIRERVLQLRGTVEIVSSEGQGTAIIVAIPEAGQPGAAGAIQHRTGALTTDRPQT